MVRIPEAQRRAFESGIVRPQGDVNLGRISAAAAPYEALSQVSQSINKTLQVKQEQQLVADGTEFNSRLNIQFQDAYNQLTKREDIIKNPSLIRDEIPKISQGLLESQEFLDQPPEVQALGRKTLASLNGKFGLHGLQYENEQMFKNTLLAIDKTQNNFDLEALTTDTNIDEMMQRYSASIVANVKSGALTEQQGEAQLKAGASSILLNRMQRFLNEDDLSSAQLLLNDKGNQEILGADALTKANQQVERRRVAKIEQAAKIEKLRLTDPWSFVQKVDSSVIPQVDFANPKVAPAQLSERIEFIKEKNAQYNIRLPILTDQETTGIIGIYKQLPPIQAAASLKELTSTLPDEQQGLISDAIFRKDKPLGIAISVADTSPATAHALLNGADVLNKKLVNMPSESDIRAEVNKQIADVAIDPEFRESVQQAVKNMYADGIYKDNNTTGAFDIVRINENLKELLGAKIEVNGKNTLSFRNDAGQFLDENDFIDLYRDLTPGVIEAIQGDLPRYADGTPVDEDDLRENAQLIPVGDGQYKLSFYDQFLSDKDSKEFVLDLKEIQTKLRRYGIDSIHPEQSLLDRTIKSLLNQVPGVD